jgi:hypothetical protein
VVRRYEEPIEVRAAGEQAASGGDPAEDAGAPAAFLWRGRLYVVRQVLDHWKERRPWWRDALDERPATATVPSGTASGSQVYAAASRSGGSAAVAGGTDVAGQGGSAVDVLGDARERQVWRVEASAGRMAGTGVYDLGVDPSPGQWRLLRVAD